MVHLAYFTDPLCPWSWGAEPQIRRIEVEFAGEVELTYVMAGMSEDIDPEQKLASTLDMIAETGMPADPRVWTEDPARSSHPACAAVKAAGRQGREADYLRRLREGVMLRRERLDGEAALLAAARDVAGLDVARFEGDLRSDAVAAAFAADRETAAAACGDHRPALPAFRVGDEDVIGAGELRDAVLAAGAVPGALPAPEDAVARFGRLAAAEVTEICGLPEASVRAALWRSADEGRLRAVPLPFGEVWEPV